MNKIKKTIFSIVIRLINSEASNKTLSLSKNIFSRKFFSVCPYKNHFSSFSINKNYYFKKAFQEVSENIKNLREMHNNLVVS